jgi:hypothetical protein
MHRFGFGDAFALMVKATNSVQSVCHENIRARLWNKNRGVVWTESSSARA